MQSIDTIRRNRPIVNWQFVNWNLSSEKNAFQNVVCKISAIIFKPQYVILSKIRYFERYLCRKILAYSPPFLLTWNAKVVISMNFFMTSNTMAIPFYCDHTSLVSHIFREFLVVLIIWCALWGTMETGADIQSPYVMWGLDVALTNAPSSISTFISNPPWMLCHYALLLSTVSFILLQKFRNWNDPQITWGYKIMICLPVEHNIHIYCNIPLNSD